MFRTNTLNGSAPLAYPSICTGPPGRALSASTHLHTTKMYHIQIQHGALWAAPAAVETLMNPGCCCFVCFERHTHTVTLRHLYCPCPCLMVTRGPHVLGEMLIQRKVSPNVSFIFQHWQTAAASSMNKVYLETVCELNCKQIWMFYGWS